MSRPFDFRKQLKCFAKFRSHFVFSPVLYVINIIIRKNLIVFWFDNKLAKLQFFNDEYGLYHSNIATIYSIFSELSFCLLIIIPNNLSDFFIQKVGKKLFSFETQIICLFVQEASDIFAQEWNLTVDKFFNFDKSVFDLKN